MAAVVAALLGLGAAVAHGATQGSAPQTLTPVDCASGLLNVGSFTDVVDPNAPSVELPDPLTQVMEYLSWTSLGKVYGDQLRPVVTYDSDDEYIVSVALEGRAVGEFSFRPRPGGWSLSSQRVCSPKEIADSSTHS